MKRFYEVRRSVLQAWALATKRQIVDEVGELTTDSFVGAFECQWQNSFEDGHVNLFCSLGDWGCNITDILRDSRYDYLNMEDENEAKVLFRYYTRFLLIISEMLTDFQDIFIHTEGLRPSRQSKQAARQFYSQPFNRDLYTDTLNFINSVCKHKTQHIHLCNNHSKIIFEDSGVVPLEFNYVMIGDTWSNANKDAILMPYLSTFTNLIIASYVLLDEHFKRNPHKFMALCEIFKS